MLELTIGEKVYQFNFGIGFVRRVNSRAKVEIPGLSGTQADVGLAYMVTQILSGDVIALVDALVAANSGTNPRITAKELEAYIDDESTDIDALFQEVIDFLLKANATKKTTASVKETLDAENAE